MDRRTWWARVHGVAESDMPEQLTQKAQEFFPDGSAIKNPLVNAGDAGSMPGLRRFPREGNGNPLQYSCLENPVDRGAWRTAVHRVALSWT